MNNTGHGHVTPRADGVRTRCGGPGLCTVCMREAAALAQAKKHRRRTKELSQIAPPTQHSAGNNEAVTEATNTALPWDE